MIVLNENDIREMGVDWHKTINVIEHAVDCLAEKEFEQPLKPYLRYRDKRNRIIAMPAFVGGKINKAGIKWIASFPGNIEKGIPRAHSVTVLNDADTGEPVAVICTPLVSIIRTASVSGLVLRQYLQNKKTGKMKIGIIGFGPIGQYHLKMCRSILGDRLDSISLFDLRAVDTSKIENDDKIEIVNSWEDAYQDADIVITCTVANAPYINKKPKAGSLHLNVSLRDYTTAMYEWFKNSILVDDWEEVCREKTDIEMMHIEKNLQEEDTRSIVDIIHYNAFEDYAEETPVMFNPMGMAVFDIAIADYYYKAVNREVLSAEAL